MPPYLNSVNPNSGDAGDSISVEILGDVFSHVTKCDFGHNIEVERFQIIDDGKIKAEIAIENRAAAGKRDVILTDPTGDGRLANGFEVL